MIKSLIEKSEYYLAHLLKNGHRRYNAVRLQSRLLTLVLISGITSVVVAAERFEVMTGFGFDWYKPTQASCKKMTASVIQTLATCAFKTSGAFGLSLSYYACPLKDKGEVLVFKGYKQCQEAIETMRANEP